MLEVFKSKGVILGIAVTALASVLLVAGMGITTSAGAATDGGGAVGGPNGSLTGGTPPQSPVEQPVVNPTTPGGAPIAADDNAGGTAGLTGGPSALPNAGAGAPQGSASVLSAIILFSMAGAVLVGAGATTVGTSRRK